MQQLRPDARVERRRPLLDQPQPEVDVAQQSPLVRLPEDRAPAELAGAPDVVHERRREQQVAAQPRMKLRRLAAERRHADRVLEQPARIRVVAVDRRRQRPQRRPRLRIEHALHRGVQARVRDLRSEELEETLQLVGVAPHRRRHRARVDTLGGLERAHVELEPVAELLHPAEHAHGVALGEARVEQLDVVPHARADPPARVDELEREIRRAVLRAQALLLRHRVDALEGAVLLELRDRGHVEESRAAVRCYGQPVATIRPFRALRYDEAVAGPLAGLVAPPYDVITPEQRAAYLARSPYNVVHLTLPDSEEQAAHDLADWRGRGVLAEEAEPSFWWLSQDYVGPDGIARRRDGFVAALRVEPYDERIVLPHERTHAGPKEGRLRLLRATRTQLEPIFLLWDGTIDVDGLGEPDLAAEEGGVTSRLWRLGAEFGDALAEELRDAQLLIADGHHRYETALAFHAEDGTEESAWMLVVIVPTAQDGVTIFPTHRIAQSVNGVAGTPIDQPGDDLPGLVLYRGGGRYELLAGDGLDPELVDRLGPQGVTYTPHASEAVAAVDRGEATAAFLLRPTRIEDVWAVAERGDVLPQKSTFFYPKLTSGLLLMPL
jgi:uncharacterized protein (DUF1015 family)